MDELPPLGGPGQRLGRYGLLQRIAVGGMAEVYRAWAEGPGDFRKLVAIKRLLPQHALDPQLLRMFLDESRLMARFGHPNLPQVIDVSDGGGVDVPFFVMEHVSGVDLREILRAAGGALPVEHIVTIATGVAAGLHHAHELRADDGRPLDIVHRDVSPSNVLVSFDGTVKVTDFGVAKWLQQKSFTYQGQLKGKFAHMSPEQCRGEPLDRRSDVFALGTLLYEMATGRPPFEADTELELLSKIASQDAIWPGGPPSGLKAELPESFGAIIMRALRRNRADRFATTREMQLALEGWAREEKVVASAVSLGAYVEGLFADRLAELRAVPLATRGAGDGPGGDGLTALERTATDAFAVDIGAGPIGEASDGPAERSTDPHVTSTDGEPAARPSSARDHVQQALAGASSDVRARAIASATITAADAAPTALPSSVPAGVPRTATSATRARRGGARQRVLGLAALGVAAALAIAVQQLTRSNEAPAFEPAAPPSRPAAVAPPPPPVTTAPAASAASVAEAQPVPPDSRAEVRRHDPTSARAQRPRRAAKDSGRVAAALGAGRAPATSTAGGEEAHPDPVGASAPNPAAVAPMASQPVRPAPTKVWDPDSPVPP